MTFAFVHTADWQIGKPFGGFPADTAALLREARLESIGRIAAVAGTAGVRHVLVAGDVFDSATAPDRLIGSLLARLAGQSTLSWHLLPGNHDPATSGGVWQRLRANGVPANVRLHLTAAPHELEPGVVLLPAPLHAKAVADDPTRWMDTASSPPGTIRIGFAHGSVQGFGSAGETQVPIDPARRRSARLDYFALGDWHGVKEIAPAVWYSGTPEPDQFPANEPGHVLVVRIAAAGAPAAVTPVATAAFIWHRRQLHIRSADDLAPLEREVDRLAPESQRHLIRLDIAGRITVAENIALGRRLVALRDRLRALDDDTTQLVVTPEAADLDQLPAGPLRDIAQGLAARTEPAGSAEAKVALTALMRLAAFAAEGDGAA